MLGSTGMKVWRITRSRALWAWRFHSLGARCSVGKCRLIRNAKTISIGSQTLLSDGWSLVDLTPSVAETPPKIRIGSYCNIMHDFQCNAAVSVELQDYVLVAPRVFITDSDHIVGESSERTTLSSEFRSARVVIEHDCWLGVNVVVLKGVRIGHHTIVGANAVVTRNVEPHSIVTGIPAKAIGRTGAHHSKLAGRALLT